MTRIAEQHGYEVWVHYDHTAEVYEMFASEEGSDYIGCADTLSEARQFLFASLLLADQLIDDKGEAVAAPPPPRPDPAVILRAESLADRLESLAMALENEDANP